MSGIAVGDKISATSKLGVLPSATERMGPFTAQKWQLPNGNELSATALSETGEIVYLESNWGGVESGARSDFPGFEYGRTDLAAIREALGSNGFAIAGRMAEPLSDGAMALFNAYELAGDEGPVVVFVTKVAASDVPAARAAPQRLSEFARLDTIILSNPGYLEATWGPERTYDPAYRPIEWPHRAEPEWLSYAPDNEAVKELLDPKSINGSLLKELAAVDLHGGDYAVEKNVTLGECKSACATDQKCEAVTYNTRVSWCFLKAGGWTQKGHPDAHSIIVRQTPQPVSSPEQASSGGRQPNGGIQQELPGIDLFGGDYLFQEDVSVDECRAACVGDAACQAFTYNADVSWCFLKHGKWTQKPHASAYSAVVRNAPTISPDNPLPASDPGEAVEEAIGAIRAGDHSTALSILYPLVRDGDAAAQHNLAVMLATGEGVPQDFPSAQVLFRMAARQGYGLSFNSLGVMFSRGEGVDTDLVEAYRWFELARRAMTAHAAEWPQLVSETKQSLAVLSQHLTPEEIETASRRADEWPEESRSAEMVARRTQEMTLADYVEVCGKYRSLDFGIREMGDLLFAEMIEGKSDLLTCGTIVEFNLATKQCDRRDPSLRELLVYLDVMAEMSSTFQGLPAPVGVATALVIGGYCKPSRPGDDGQETLFETLREA